MSKEQDKVVDPFATADEKADAKAAELLEKAKQHEKQKKEKERERRNEGKGGIGQYVKEVKTELSRTTWPTKGELVRWCGIVLGTIALFAGFAAIVDNLMAAPLVYWISSLHTGNAVFDILCIVLCVIWLLSGVGIFVGVFLHQGGETEGLSDTALSKISGGSSIVQKNLDRLTTVAIIVFVATLIAMMIVLPQASIVAG